ncbi:4-hydroxybenzoate polyprenyltransferase [Lutibacter agarilyticus]|uniref:4-hydroxybenzoate polyprenyltransferase n=1 Tax=Lutibacter agarilyticus TaxID=1109740 RepID=A0A238VGX1_9FLAO|nr:geranylgeranylglycerol-phosphate geranylgeranyltransferase [Lutibacter agarilyticus]SNR33652.1 4-hydroxybenzoate polyprenyltransferase [Lutibacter agarilyticus]
MKLSVYFKLIRWRNLFLIAYVFILLKYILFPSFNLNTLLSNFQFSILLISVLLITAAGYIINDIFDIKADKINKPTKVIVSTKITVEQAKAWYKITNAFGIILGVLLAINIQKPSYSFLFIGTSILLYYYSKQLKKTPFIGNLAVAFSIALSILLVPLFEIDFTIQNKSQLIIIQFIILLSLFAFVLNLTREIVKDIIDINGDYNLKNNTLPIVIGRKRARNFALTLCSFTLLSLLYFTLHFSKQYKFTLLYLVVFIVLPMLYISVKLNASKTKKQFQKISTLLKVCMFLGINSIIIFSILH